METEINLTSDVSNNHTRNVSSFPPEVLRVGAIFTVIFTVVGITGNLISILALLRCKKLRNATTAFIINLCIADFLFCSVSMPLTASTYIDNKWSHGDNMCKLLAFVKTMNSIVSVFTVLAITINRFILIVYPNIYPLIYSWWNMVIMLLIVWGIPLTILLLSLFEIWGTLGYDSKELNCTIQERPGENPRIVIVVMFAVVPSVLFVGCYIKIYFVVRRITEKAGREQNQIDSNHTRHGLYRKNNPSKIKETCKYFRSKKEFRLLGMLLVMFIFFILCYFPFTLHRILNKKNNYPGFFMFSVLCLFFSNVINPFIYVVMSREYRMAYKNLFAFKQNILSLQSSSNVKTSMELIVR